MRANPTAEAWGSSPRQVPKRGPVINSDSTVLCREHDCGSGLLRAASPPPRVGALTGAVPHVSAAAALSSRSIRPNGCVMTGRWTQTPAPPWKGSGNKRRQTTKSHCRVLSKTLSAQGIDHKPKQRTEIIGRIDRMSANRLMLFHRKRFMTQ